MTTTDPVTPYAPAPAQERRGAHTVADRITAGSPYALAFGGQGVPWLEPLAELVRDFALEGELDALVTEAESLIAPVAAQIAVAGTPFDPIVWASGIAVAESAEDQDADAVPSADVLGSAAVSLPGILLTQLAGLRALRRQGIDPRVTPPVAVLSHSQGVLARHAVEREGHADVKTLALARLIGAASTIVGRRRGLLAGQDAPAMVSIANVDADRLDEILADFANTPGRAVRRIRNARRSFVLSGSPDALKVLERRCEQIVVKESAEREAKKRGGTPFSPVFEPLSAQAAFHHPELVDVADLVAEWATECGLDAENARVLTLAATVDPVDWVASVEEATKAGAAWILDLGPADLLTRMTSRELRGTAIQILAPTTRRGHRLLTAAGAQPRMNRSWQEFAPRIVSLPDGSVRVETRFSALTGRSPILLAGMTPTTVDAGIVAAAANAGFWAELAGGGQVTEQIFTDRIADMGELLDEGRSFQFNALLLDPYLWKLQLGQKRLVQRARGNGAAIDGVIVSAGIPELDDAVALVAELRAADLNYIAFKPGTLAQIKSVIEIADEVSPTPLIVQIEGGKAGGHHSWEDLDELLLATYSDLRERDNIVVCVGGGIGTPERAADYLTGTWSTQRGYRSMPIDGILVGTAAMATLEATTAPDVKQLLVETEGTPEWIAAGSAAAGIASGRSQLGADIHEVDNTASRCGRLLDEVAGDTDAVESRREEIIKALNATAKPYFGDTTTMTYAQWLERYAELAVGDLGWADVTWCDRFHLMLQRAEARLNDADKGRIPTLFAAADLIGDPGEAIESLIAAYPAATSVLLHPADNSFFVELCKTPGKPVNFVPVLDGDVRRWWRSDSLWQAHDSRYSADEVCIIPGPVSVAGIDRVDEPVAELLQRFEEATIDELLAGGDSPRRVNGRRRVDGGSGPLSLALAAPDLVWAGRMTRNPIHRLGGVSEWIFADDTSAEHPATGASLHTVDPRTVKLSVPLGANRSLHLLIDVADAVATGAAPRITEEIAADAMMALLGAAAGGRLPIVEAGETTLTVLWNPDQIADHRGVTANSLGKGLVAGSSTVPDAVVGLCWPAVFAVIGDARSTDGVAAIEGMLDLVHLDHVIAFDAELPATSADLVITARQEAVFDTEVGRVIEVAVTVQTVDGIRVATLTERFAIRGRTGDAELADPVSAGGTVAGEISDTPRRSRGTATVTAPLDMRAFATVSGDHNPIHTSAAAARLAGLGDPIVHGMWLSAAAQQVVVAQGHEHGGARRLTGWTARFLAPLRLGAAVDIRAARIGLDNGADVLDVTCRSDGELVMAATARTEAPRTAYAFPGQGIQSKGMGMDAYARSKAAREVWDRADQHTREALGFSILTVVRDNPTYLKARGVEHRHPDGVLYLTQFTQVSMATLGAAQTAELREAGAFVEGAMLCGHSVGEYNALAAVSGVIPLEAVLEVVFQRGSVMHELVPRDEQGRSDYRLAAIRPSQLGLADDLVADFVTAVAADNDEFLEIVNYNLRGSQYAIAGTIRGLEALEREVNRLRDEFGGRNAFIVVPGIDVPFHSSVLRSGVPDFRSRLDELLPAHIDPDVLTGRYVPNLVPKPFSLQRAFVQEIADLVPSEPLDEVLADFDTWAANPGALCRTLLIELLAWQFASPVRWIETQDLLFGPAGIERFVEIGVGAAPTVANLASATLKLPGRDGSPVEVLNFEREKAVLFAIDADPVDDDVDDAPAASSAPKTAAPAAGEVFPSNGLPAAGGPRPDDIAFAASDATSILVAFGTKMRVDQIGAADSFESLCDGVSSRRNQLLVDLGTELSLGAIDGAADADAATLAATVNKLARTYRAFGPVLSEATNDRLRQAFGPTGRRPAAIAERVTGTWQLGSGWSDHVTAEVALGTREGDSVRGGALGGYGALATGADVDAVIDAAVAAVAARKGVQVSLPAAQGADSMVDAAALAEFTDQITGTDGVLASTARHLLAELGLDQGVDDVAADKFDAEVVKLVTSELGSDWPRLVAPAFESARALLIDDRWASAREDLATIWTGGDVKASFTGTGDIVAKQARWWESRAEQEGRVDLSARYGDIADQAVDDVPGIWADETAVVTGASAGSIAASVIGDLLAGGATVIATTSRLDQKRLSFYRELYRDRARGGAALWVVPANLASFADVDAVIEWIGNDQIEVSGGVKQLVKPAIRPTLLFPFAAPQVMGDLTDAGARAELDMRVLLWSVERLIGGLSAVGHETDIDSTLHVVLPGSPNRGKFGGDGSYGEAKAALDAVVAKWHAERSWGSRVSLIHAIIGWVRGTGLMGRNDPLVGAVETAGVHTWSPDEMAAELLKACSDEARKLALDGPIELDLTGGLADVDLDLTALAAAETEEGPEPAPLTETVAALPPSPAALPVKPVIDWPELDADPADLVVIVGAGELGPYGSSRTRFEMEVADELSAAGVLELAWTTGLVGWEEQPVAGWYDAESGEHVPEQEIAERYHDRVVEACGVRTYGDDGSIVEGSAPLLTSVFLDKDLSFVVSSEAEARAFKESDPDHTVIQSAADGDWTVTRRAGTEIRVPRRMKLTRTVGGQIPTGFDPLRWGIPADMADSLDRVALWNLICTVDAFLSSGFSPAELMRWVHPAQVANTQGTGMGGMGSMHSLYIDTLLGAQKPNDLLQEALPNVIAAHVMQSYVGGYGAMVHPVGACATAVVSVEEAVDKIRLGKASLVVAGGFDDLGAEGIMGFADMSATADSAAMSAKGIENRYFSRANDRRRGGFVESQGGGTVLLARGDVAQEMGLPVLGVLAWAGSFADGIHTSIPAPGIGALSAARGGPESDLARWLARLGVGADDIAVISKHDTSTNANDPNESELHERIAGALGRSAGAPLFVVSQKSLTGHAKGGAGAFQLIGLCQVLDGGVIPPNRSLDCVDDVLADHEHLVWLRQSLPGGDTLPLRAGLLTSLGFGHVSGLLAVVHPQAFLASLPADERADYEARAAQRRVDGRMRLVESMCGGEPMYERPADRRFGAEGVRELEAATMLDPDARLGEGNVYERTACR